MSRPGSDFPILIISLADAVDRQRKLSGSLEALGLEYEFVTAIDGRNGLPSGCEPLVDRAGCARNMLRAITDGEAACALSHRMIYSMIVDRGLPGAVVLEDDAIVGSPFASFMRERAYLSAPMILLDYRRASVLRRSGRKLGDGLEIWRLAQSPTLATGYSIAHDPARKMLAATTPVRDRADWPVDLHSVGGWASVPRLVGHPPNDVETSYLERDRKRAEEGRGRKRWDRMLKAHYWRNKLAKRIG